jgi:hypothetical protein
MSPLLKYAGAYTGADPVAAACTGVDGLEEKRNPRPAATRQIAPAIAKVFENMSASECRN